MIYKHQTRSKEFYKILFTIFIVINGYASRGLFGALEVRGGTSRPSLPTFNCSFAKKKFGHPCR